MVFMMSNVLIDKEYICPMNEGYIKKYVDFTPYTFGKNSVSNVVFPNRLTDTLVYSSITGKVTGVIKTKNWIRVQVSDDTFNATYFNLNTLKISKGSSLSKGEILGSISPIDGFLQFKLENSKTNEVIKDCCKIKPISLSR